MNLPASNTNILLIASQFFCMDAGGLLTCRNFVLSIVIIERLILISNNGGF